MSGREAFFATLDVSRETAERLDRYAALLTKWNTSINLVSKSTLPLLWMRHFLDSAQLLQLAPDGEIWADLGTGGGFPGLVVAILAAEQRPNLKVICVESDLRKATFLRAVVRETGLDAEVIAERIEAVAPIGADILTARALAPLETLLGFAERHLRPRGTALFPKGGSHAKEVEQALATWSFRLDTYPSKTDPAATILKLGEIQRV